MGNTESSREIYRDWRVCGVSGTIQPPSKQFLPTVGDITARPLEGSSNSSNPIEYVDPRKLRTITEVAAMGPIYSTISRYGTGILITWALGATIIASVSLFTVYRMTQALQHIEMVVEEKRVEAFLEKMEN